MANLGSDPGFNSFIQQLEQNRAAALAEDARRRASNQAARDLTFGELVNREEQGLDLVDDDFEGRGMFRSGGRLEGRADLVQGINELRTRADFDLAEGNAQSGRDTARILSDLATRRIAEENAARGRITQRELAEAAQAQAERLAAEERQRWNEEQKRLQTLYDAQAAAARAAAAASARQNNSGGGGFIGGGGGGYRPQPAPPRFKPKSKSNTTANNLQRGNPPPPRPPSYYLPPSKRHTLGGPSSKGSNIF